MGYITRRLTYQVAVRRFSLPTQFLAAHGLEAQARLWMAAPDAATRLLFTTAQWEALETTVRQVPSASTLRALLASGETIELGSQGRLVLPRKLAFDADEAKLELTWEIEGGVLVVTNPAARASRPSAAAGQGATGNATSANAATGQAATGKVTTGQAATGSAATGEAATGQAATGQAVSGSAANREPANREPANEEAAREKRAGEAAPAESAGALAPGQVGQAGGSGEEAAGKRGSSRNRLYGPLPDGLTLPGPVQEVALGRIHGFDPDLPPEDYDRSLAEDIAEQGMLRPVVLAGSAPHRVIDGRKRLLVAQAIGLATVPAVVLSNLSRDDQAKLRYLLETTSDRWAIARQLRVMARLHLNGASLDALSGLLRKKKRTVQRYLRIAQDNGLVDAIERGEISLLEAERRAGIN